MPPPTSTDPWLAARRFGVVIDAGSSGSRLQIYSWKDPGVVLAEKGDIVRNTLPKVEKGVQVGEDWITKVEPGLSSFADNPEGVASYLEPLIQHAQSQIPPSLESETPLFLLATAGMRLLSPVQQARVLNAVCQYLRSSSNFRIDDESKDGPCGLSEGLFGWIAVNYLMDGFTGGKSEKTTYGFLDMGGASTQIAFEPADSDLRNVRLRLLGGEEGQAPGVRDDLVGIWDESGKGTDLILSEGRPQSAHSSVPYQLIGTGSFTQCLQKTAPLLNKEAPCSEAPCLFNGVHVPPINFSSSRFIGVSEYWYSSEHIFGLGGPYDFVHAGLLGGDGEVLQNGEVIQTGLSRLQMQCFKAAWIVNVLHEGIGIPRIVAQQAEKKGLGRPLFQSMDNVGDIAISWTLGKMVLEASKAVKPLSIHSRPLVDPVQDIPVTSQNPPIKPIRPPFFDLDMIEEKLSQHLPPALSRGSLGFSPVTFLLYVFSALLLVCMASRLRRMLRHTFRRIRRSPIKRDLDTTYSMEEGSLSSGASLRSSTRSMPPLFRSLRRFLSSSPTRPRLTPLSTTSTCPRLRHSLSFPSATSPAYQHPAFGTSTASQYHSRSSSPTPTVFVFDENSSTTATLSNSLSSVSSCTPNIARSRNSSQMNLTTLVPRQMSLSRASSASHIHSEVFEDE
ncbi:nucleoside phosphatase family-domain-containing protein [Pisolithus microcarpus]|nr:nucleoside phosphatase family-domain-containing protein [Pisolithus microcarpus]